MCPFMQRLSEWFATRVHLIVDAESLQQHNYIKSPFANRCTSFHSLLILCSINRGAGFLLNMAAELKQNKIILNVDFPKEDYFNEFEAFLCENLHVMTK